MFITAYCFILPLLVPAAKSYQYFNEDAVFTVMLAVIILSFPTSTLAAPIILLLNMMLGTFGSPVAGLYLNLFLFSAFGAVQWFWIVPRWRYNKPGLQSLNLPDGRLAAALGEARAHAFDSEGRTPLERVIGEDREGVIRS
jgi:hypothetical protein